MRDGITLSEVFSTVCSAPDCEVEALEDVPFPICTYHYIAIIRNYRDQIDKHGLARDEYEAMLTGRMMADDPVHAVEAKPMCVYFIRMGDRVKIGTTNSVKRRLTELPFDELLAVIPGGYAVEHQWHERYSMARVQGEWFRLTAKMEAEIRNLGITNAAA